MSLQFNTEDTGCPVIRDKVFRMLANKDIGDCSQAVSIMGAKESRTDADVYVSPALARLIPKNMSFLAKRDVKVKVATEGEFGNLSLSSIWMALSYKMRTTDDGMDKAVYIVVGMVVELAGVLKEVT